MGQGQTEHLKKATELSGTVSGVLLTCALNILCMHAYVFLPQIAGLKTNKEFVACLAGHPSFQQADVHTGFIPVNIESTQSVVLANMYSNIKKHCLLLVLPLRHSSWH